MAQNRRVIVWGKSCYIWVEKSGPVWIASGHYQGENVKAEGSNPVSAVEEWRNSARWRGIDFKVLH